MERLLANKASVCIFALFAILLVFIFSYFELLAELVSLWSGAEQSESSLNYFGFVILTCVAYLLYLKKREFRNLDVSPSKWALLAGLALSAIWVIASLAVVQTIQLALLPLLILSAIWASLGTQYLKKALLPGIILTLAMPLWWPLIPYLKIATTAITETFLRTIGKPVFVDGFYLHLPGGSFLVDDGCAGLRFLMVTVILTLIGVDMNSLSARQGLVLLLTGVVLALIANWIRVIVVVLIGDATLMQSSIVDDHYTLGWIVYSILVLGPILLILRYLTGPDHVVQTENVNVSGTAIPTPAGFITALVLSITILVSGPVFTSLLKNQISETRNVVIPESQPEWVIQRVDSQFESWSPAFGNESRYLNNVYVKDNVAVELHIVHYSDQVLGGELINDENMIADGVNWEDVSGTEEQISFATKTAELPDVNAVQVRSQSGELKLVWYWFDIGGFESNDNYQAKLYQILSLFRGRADANLIAIAASCPRNCSLAEEGLESFLQDMHGAIKSGL